MGEIDRVGDISKETQDFGLKALRLGSSRTSDIILDRAGDRQHEIGNDWEKAPVLSLDELERDHRSNHSKRQHS